MRTLIHRDRVMCRAAHVKQEYQLWRMVRKQDYIPGVSLSSDTAFRRIPWSSLPYALDPLTDANAQRLRMRALHLNGQLNTPIGPFLRIWLRETVLCEL